MIVTPTRAALTHGRPRRNRAAGHSRGPRLPGTIVALLVAASALAGCRPTSEMSGGRYKHNGRGFAVAVPAGWVHTELGGDLVVRIEGPMVDERLRPVVHVFCRDEWTEVDPEATAAELFRLMEVEAAVPGAGPTREGAAPEEATAGKELSNEAAEVSGLPARRVVRAVATRTGRLREETLFTSRGKRAWALVVSVPETADESVRAAVDEIRRSFEVW